MSENNRSRSGSGRRGHGGSGRNSGSGRIAARTGSRNSLLIIILSVVVTVSVIAGALVGAKRKGNGNSAGSGSSSQAESSIEVIANDNKLELNKYPAVNELIANYRKAFKEGDTDLLKKVYNTDEEINKSILTGTSAVIEDYKNTQYYTKNGLKSGEYVAFVYDELKLADIKTLAPNLSVFYIKTTDNGTLYIYRGEYDSASGSYKYDEKTQAYIDKLYKDEDVMKLITTVNTKMDSACANDSDLMSFMEKLRSQTDSSIEQAETEAETASDASSSEAGSSSSSSSTASSSASDDSSSSSSQASDENTASEAETDQAE